VIALKITIGAFAGSRCEEREAESSPSADAVQRAVVRRPFIVPSSMRGSSGRHRPVVGLEDVDPRNDGLWFGAFLALVEPGPRTPREGQPFGSILLDVLEPGDSRPVRISRPQKPSPHMTAGRLVATGAQPLGRRARGATRRRSAQPDTPAPAHAIGPEPPMIIDGIRRRVPLLGENAHSTHHATLAA